MPKILSQPISLEESPQILVQFQDHGTLKRSAKVRLWLPPHQDPDLGSFGNDEITRPRRKESVTVAEERLVTGIYQEKESVWEFPTVPEHVQRRTEQLSLQWRLR